MFENDPNPIGGEWLVHTAKCTRLHIVHNYNYKETRDSKSWFQTSNHDLK